MRCLALVRYLIIHLSIGFASKIVFFTAWERNTDVLQKRFFGRTEPIANLSGIDNSVFQSEGFPDELDLPKDVPFSNHLTWPFQIMSRTS